MHPHLAYDRAELARLNAAQLGVALGALATDHTVKKFAADDHHFALLIAEDSRLQSAIEASIERNAAKIRPLQARYESAMKILAAAGAALEAKRTEAEEERSALEGQRREGRDAMRQILYERQRLRDTAKFVK